MIDNKDIAILNELVILTDKMDEIDINGKYFSTETK